MGQKEQAEELKRKQERLSDLAHPALPRPALPCRRHSIIWAFETFRARIPTLDERDVRICYGRYLNDVCTGRGRGKDGVTKSK